MVRFVKKSIISLTILIAVLALCSLAASVYIFNSRASIYPYPVTKDYQYIFPQEHAEVTELQLINGAVQVPHLAAPNQSAFLKLYIETSFPGNYLEPSITFSCGASSCSQYFERGAAGIRYLNISSLQLTGGEQISFSGEHVAIPDQSVQLIRFTDENIKSKKIVVLAPHPDDAEIAAYGLYSDNRQSHIVTVTAGDASTYKYNEIYPNRASHFRKMGELRTWNSITVPLLARIPAEQIINLGFFDLTLKKMFHARTTPVQGRFTRATDINTYRQLNLSSLGRNLPGDASWTSLVNNLAYLLAEIKPEIIVTPYPKLDRHPDHKLTTVAIIEAIKDAGLRDGRLFLYSNHFVLNEFFPYGEQGGTISLPPNFDDSLYFDAIYSHPLPADKQKDKLLALEAMNDLRPDTEWRFLRGSFDLFIRKLKHLRTGENSYFRRAVRSNELFFVVDMAHLYDQQILDRIIGEM